MPALRVHHYREGVAGVGGVSGPTAAVDTVMKTLQCIECGEEASCTDEEYFATINQGLWKALPAQKPDGYAATAHIHRHCRRVWEAKQPFPTAIVVL